MYGSLIAKDTAAVLPPAAAQRPSPVAPLAALHLRVQQHGGSAGTGRGHAPGPERGERFSDRLFPKWTPLGETKQSSFLRLTVIPLKLHLQPLLLFLKWMLLGETEQSSILHLTLIPLKLQLQTPLTTPPFISFIF